MSIATRAVRLLCPRRSSRLSSRSLALSPGRFARRDLVCSVVRDQPSERSERRVAAVHAVGGINADLQHDGRAQLRSRELLYARRVCGLRARGAWWLLVCAGCFAAARWHAWRFVRAVFIASDRNARRAGRASRSEERRVGKE